MLRVIILIGIPASGKSSCALKIAQTHTKAIAIISTDLIRSQLYGSPLIQGKWAEIYDEIQIQFQQSYEAHKSVIYDATNYLNQYRREIINLSKTTGFTTVTGIWLNVPLWICLQRNERRPHPVPENVILEMYQALMHRSPSWDEGFDSLMIQEDGALDDSLL
jgi:predicted kinase